MSDRETLKAMFDRGGVLYTDDKGPHNFGYNGFVAIFEFDDNGNLNGVGAWE